MQALVDRSSEGLLTAAKKAVADDVREKAPNEILYLCHHKTKAMFFRHLCSDFNPRFFHFLPAWHFYMDIFPDTTVTFVGASITLKT